MGYKLNLIVETNTFSNDALKYKLISTNTSSNGQTVPSNTSFANIGTGAGTINLGAGYFDVPTDGNKIHTYNLELYFPDTGVNQNVDQGKIFTAYVTVENFDYSTLAYDESKGVNKPVLFTGMTPVKWDESFNEVETNKDDPDWYNYNNKEWANAKTADGSYWVWIPRFAYKITSGYHSTTTGTIDIKFLKSETIETNDGTAIENEGYISGVKDTSIHYFLHPSFETEGSKLGIWVAKYESTASEGVSSGSSSCVAADNVSTKTVKVIPNATSWRCITNSNAFAAVKNMKTSPVYGWESAQVDSHTMTNLEWGAVTYLSKPAYGTNTKEIWNNSYNQYLTGCSGTGVSPAGEASCVAYNTTNGVKASTTHNIYGIYDMSGGAWESVSGYVNNGHSNLSTYGLSILNADSKYKNIYSVGAPDNRPTNYEINKNIYGDAVYETSSRGDSSAGSWFVDYSYIPFASYPWFYRGGHWGYSTSAGPFSFDSSIGNADVNYSFRAVVSLQK